MIKGLFISDQGEVQFIGDINNLRLIIDTVKILPKELERMQIQLYAKALTPEQLQEIQTMKANTGKTERLEP